MKRNSTFWIFTIAVIVALTIPILVQDGMFLDGITYSTVSKNMANGYGSPLNPHYTKTLYPEFHEQPPFGLVLQSYFFKFLGNNFYTERIYCLLILVLSIIGIAKIWRLVADKTEWKKYDWLPVLLWITLPLVSWSYNNNLLENTMGMFTIFAVFSTLKSIIEKNFVYLFLGSILIVLAFLSKGFAGLFPITIPLLYALAYKQTQYTIIYAAWLVASTLFIAFISFLLFPGLKNNILLYMDQHFIPALNNKREITTDNRLSILVKLLIQLSFPIALIIYISIITWRKNRQSIFAENKNAFFFLLVALAASVPLIVSLKQRKYYLAPSLPFYALSVSFLLISHLKTWFEKFSTSALLWTKRISFAIFIGVILFSMISFGRFSRDRENLTDVYAISQVVPEGTIITTTEDLSVNWVLVAYMSRIGYLSLDSKNQHDYYLLDNNSKIENALLGNYQDTGLRLRKYVLLKKR